MKNWINWFEIPATNFERAVTFYSGVFQIEMHTMDMGGTQMAMFPAEGGGGALVQGEGYTPSMDGSLVYLNGGEDLSAPLGRIEGAGGKVIVPKTHIGEGMGYFAMFIDTEGNKVALHSMN
jgi:uncharacterized protein